MGVDRVRHDATVSRASRARRIIARGVIVLLLGALPSAAQTPGINVDAPGQLADVAERVRAVDRDHLSRALARAGLGVPPRVGVTLIAADDPRALEAPPWVVARAYGTETVEIYPGRIQSYPYGSLESVVLHEIVHLALNARALGYPLPRWFHEGVAVSVESGWGIGSQARLLWAAARGPAIEDVDALFASDASPETTTAYLLSAALVEDVRRRHGLDVPGLIAARVANGESFDAAFVATTGETVDEAAQQAWRVYRGLRWMPILTSPHSLWGWILLLAFVAFVVRVTRRRRKRWEEDDAIDHEERGDPPETVH
jgi:hypothetical protein